MKRFLFILLCLLLPITAYASTSDNNQLVYEYLDITIIFEENTAFQENERQYIANLLIHGTTDTNDVSTYAWCWLTGHDLITEAVAEIQHKVSETEPRCRRTIYEVSTCSKCDHVETTNLGSTFIFCCPED